MACGISGGRPGAVRSFSGKGVFRPDSHVLSFKEGHSAPKGALFFGSLIIGEGQPSLSAGDGMPLLCALLSNYPADRACGICEERCLFSFTVMTACCSGMTPCDGPFGTKAGCFLSWISLSPQDSVCAKDEKNKEKQNIIIWYAKKIRDMKLFGKIKLTLKFVFISVLFNGGCKRAGRQKGILRGRLEAAGEHGRFARPQRGLLLEK